MKLTALYLRLRRWIDDLFATLFAAAGLGLIRAAFARGAAG